MLLLNARSAAAYSEVHQETKLRALRTVLAIQIWRHTHGEFPSRLEQLTDSLTGAIPIEPATGQAFLYSRAGPRELSATTGVLRQYRWRLVEAGQPFVASGINTTLSAGQTHEVSIEGEVVAVPALHSAAFPVPKMGWNCGGLVDGALRGCELTELAKIQCVTA